MAEVIEMPMKVRQVLFETLRCNASLPRYAPTTQWQECNGAYKPMNPLAKAVCNLAGASKQTETQKEERVFMLTKDQMGLVRELGFAIEVKHA